ncbi:Deoxyribose-phosphate aldolase [Pseudolycoriella hygida]|uniref:deoxyribose-phosphate aldolase n=1 Tax=Pseudolycoriella hygida TaxID=35572 RepID=A0A9Q0N800_9DIPT|nr:Deoxyribose-phosphate aldolase [Pseudolycoriella hygida]
MGYTKSQSPIPFEPKWIENVHLNLTNIEYIAADLSSSQGKVSGWNEVQWALTALRLTDLTTLAGDDSTSNVERLCLQAAYPFSSKVMRYFEEESSKKVHTAAVCVYPSRVKDAHEKLRRLNKLDQINIAAVATGFPSGQYPLETRLAEISMAIEFGATEIDVVLNRHLVLLSQWEQLYDELVQMRKVCGETVHLKTILAIGECGSMENVYKASMVAMMAGSDFIKTSTGKETINATLPVGLVMIWAIQDFKRHTGRLIGLKPAGGVRSVTDAVAWLSLIKNTLGDEWITPELFRFGASGLVDNIEKHVDGRFCKTLE